VKARRTRRMIDEIPIIKAEALHVAIGKDKVFFTIEETYQEAYDNGSNIIQVMLPKDGYRAVVWLHHTEGNMLTDLSHSEHYDKFLKWATRIYNREKHREKRYLNQQKEREI
jgi:hypothetical protein